MGYARSTTTHYALQERRENLKDETLKPTGGRPESPALATIDDTLSRLIGIRISVAIIADRARRHLTADDWRELHTILDLANGIQDDHIELRAIVSRKYQTKDPTP